jgi:hypothetical protein
MRVASVDADNRQTNAAPFAPALFSATQSNAVAVFPACVLIDHANKR